MIQLAMTPAQFAAAKAVIGSSAEVDFHNVSGPNSGSFATSQVAMSYFYNGAVLSLSVTAKYGMAHLASEDYIKDRLAMLLGKLQTT